MDHDGKETENAGRQTAAPSSHSPRPLITPGAALVVAVVALLLALAWAILALVYAASSEETPCVGGVGLGVQLVLAVFGTAAVASSVGSAIGAVRARPGALRRFAIRLGLGATAFVAWIFLLAVACG